MFSVGQYAILCILIAEVMCGSVLPKDHCARCPQKLATNDRRVIDAAMFALSKLGPGYLLSRIETANSEDRMENSPTPEGGIRKVVVGVNYQLWLKLLKLTFPYGYQPMHCRVTVWVKPDGTKQLAVSSC